MSDPSASYHPPARIRNIVIGLMLIIFLGALDQTIVAVSLPQMASDLGSASMLAWVVSGYLIASTVATPVYGKLGDLYGRRLLLTVAVLIFLIASIGCALAESMPMLILGRILQGIGGGGLISIAQAIIGEVVPLRERGRYQGYVSGMYALASVGGPVLGGYLTHLLSWRWIFWINLPLGLAALWVARRALKDLPVPRVRKAIDYFGALLLTAGLSLLLIAITRLGHGVAVFSADTLWLAGVATALLAVFAYHQGRTAEPLISPSLFRLRTVWICCAILFIVFFQVISLTALIPFGMQVMDGIGPDSAALQLIAYSLAIPVGAVIGGRWMAYSGRYKPMQLIGTALLPLALVLLAYYGPHPGTGNAVILAIAGVATGMTLPTSLVAVQNAVPPGDIGVATAMTALFRSMGGAVGVALLSAILFALMDVSGSVTDLESGLSRPAVGNPENAPFAFRVTFLVGAGVAFVAHLLAWALPEKMLRSNPTSKM